MSNFESGFEFFDGGLGVNYVFCADVLVNKKNGSCFFSREEAIKVREELLGKDADTDWRYPRYFDENETVKKRYETPDEKMWRFPTMAEIKAIFALMSVRLCNPNEFSGVEIAAKLGLTSTGRELICGAIRNPEDIAACFFWTDPVVSPGYVCLCGDKVEFCNLADFGHGISVPHTEDVSYDETGDGYYSPDPQYGYPILLLRTEETVYAEIEKITNSEFVSKYDKNK